MSEGHGFKHPIVNGRRQCRRCGRLLPFADFEAADGSIVTLDGRRHSPYCSRCREELRR